MWNLKNKINQQAKLKQTHRAESRLVAARGEGAWGTEGKGEGIKRCRLVVTEQSWGCKVQHREYSH